MYEALLWISIWGLCWAPYLNVGIGFFADTQVLFALVLILLGGRDTWREAPREVRLIGSGILVLALLCLLSSLGYERWYYVSVLRLFRALIIYWGAWAAVVLGARRWRNRIADRLTFIIYFGIVAHGALMIAQFLYPAFRERMIVWTFATEGLEVNLRTRMPGLTTGGGAQLSVFMSMAFIFFPYCYVRARRMVSRLLVALGVAIAAMAVLLSGRSGWYTALFICPFAIFCAARFSGRPGGFLRALTAMFSAVASAMVCLLAVVALNHFLSAEGGSDYDNYIFQRNLDMFLNPDEGIIENSTVLELWHNHMLIPTDFKTLMVGNLEHMDHSQGSAGESYRLLDSDIGYVRLLFSYGIIGSLLHYAIYAAMALIMWKGRRRHPLSTSMGILLIVVTFLFQAKEVFVFTRIGWSITALAYAIACFSMAKPRDTGDGFASWTPDIRPQEERRRLRAPLATRRHLGS